ncbi:MAG TPA: hypothetical protein VGS27_18690 [Candidatus Sulfotelmatobacter sp.]|nr:hypothetical protein [Candidatus Sulfotelmatobacter sp.]
MTAPGRGIFRSAVLGFAVTAVFVSYQLVTGSGSPLTRSSVLMISFVCVCPPSILSIAFDPDIGTNNFYALWTCIGVLNGALYALVRMLLGRRLRRPN